MCLFMKAEPFNCDRSVEWDKHYKFNITGFKIKQKNTVLTFVTPFSCVKPFKWNIFQVIEFFLFIHLTFVAGK